MNPMPEFDYRAIDAHGREETGRVEAPSAEAARAQLADRGCTQIEVAAREARPGPRTTTGLSASSTTRIGEGLSELTAAGLPLAEGFQAMSQEATSARDRRMLEELSRSIASGVSVEEALSKYGGADARVLTGVVRAGIRSGRLPQALDRYLDLERERREQRRGVRLSLAYPLLLSVCSAALLIGLIGLVVPMFQSITDDFGMEVPFASQALYNMAWLLRTYWRAGLMIVLIVGISLWLVAGWISPKLRAAILNELPLVGPWRRNASLARFCRLLALLVEGQTPLPEAVRLAGAGADPVLASASEQLAVDLEAGIPPAEAVVHTPGFPRLLAPVFRWHDRGAAFPEGLEEVARLLRGKSELELGFFAALCEPVVILGVGVTFAAVVFSLFFPLVHLMQELS